MPGRPCAHLLRELPQLEAATRAFQDALFSSTLDPAILDVVSSTLAVVRSTTANTLALSSIEAGAATIVIDPFLSDNPSRDKGWIGSRAGEGSTQGGGR